MAQAQPKPEALFTKLDQLLKDSEFESAIEVINKILQQLPNDLDATHCKAVALIQLGKFSDALTVLEGTPDDKFGFEKAYCLYRLKKMPEALKLLSAIPAPKAPRVLHLEAQIHYRMEDFQKTIKLYEELISKHKINTAELKTNLAAAYIGANAGAEAVKLTSRAELEQSFELCYNTACGHIETGAYTQALEFLDLAEKICISEKQAEDASDEEIADEAAPIRVQRAYVMQLMKNDAEATALYTKVLAAKPSDAAAAAVASNNVVSLRGDHDLFDSAKKLKGASASAVESKLSTAQKRAIHTNHFLILLKMNKLDAAKELISTLQADSASSSSSSSTSSNETTSALAAVLEAAVHARDKKTAPKSEELLQKYIAAHPNQSDYVQLCLAQIQLSRGDSAACAATLEKIASIRFRPAMVATLVALYNSRNDLAAAARSFDQAVAHWASQQKSAANSEILIRLLNESAHFKESHRLHQEAASTLEQLLKVYTENGSPAADRQMVTSRLVIAYASFDAKASEKYAAQLPKLAAITTGEKVDAAALENAPSYQRLKAATASPASSSSTPTAEATPTPGKPLAAGAVVVENKKKKKKKKKRLPKNYDPNVEPDPERWIPKRERLGTRRKQKKKDPNAPLARGPQGMVVREEPKGSKDGSEKGPATKAEAAAAAVPKEPAHAKGKAPLSPSPAPASSSSAAAEKPKPPASSPTTPGPGGRRRRK